MRSTIKKKKKTLLCEESLANEILNLHIAASLNAQDIHTSVQSGYLISRLRLDPKKDADFVPLPGPLLRKYITYARTYVFPR